MNIHGIKIFIVILFVFVFSLITFASQPYEDLRNHTEEDLEIFLKHLPENERGYIMKEVLFCRIEDVFSSEFQQNLMKIKFENLIDIVNELRYYKVWKLSYERIGLTGNYSFDVYKILKDNITPPQTIAYVLFDHETKTYQLLGYSKIILEQYNQIISLSISSSDEAVLYAKDGVSLISNYRPINESELIKEVSSPEVIFKSEHSYAIKIYAKKIMWHRWSIIYKLIIIVNQEGHLLIFNQKIYKD